MSLATNHLTPEEHSDIVGGSTAARRIGCPRSYALEQLVPKDDRGSEYAREGTALHELMAMALRDGVAYPAVMATHGVNDIRVDVWQSAKFTSRLAQATSSGKPVLLRVDFDAGHGMGSTINQFMDETADVWSFFLWQMGDPAFQPKDPR